MATTGIKCAAVKYRARGWSVVPVRPLDKRPLIPWREYQRRRADKAEIRGWFERCPDANIGVVTGQVSNLVVIDIDPRHGGEDSLHSLEERHGPLPRTLTVQTGGGGRHLYFAAPADPVPLRSRVALVEGVDIRAEGGLVVAPPSIHPSGCAYAWIGGAEVPQEPAALPRWMISLIRRRSEHPGHDARHWRHLAAAGVHEGERNSAIASFAGHLIWCGVDRDVIKELMLCWNRVRARPPLDDAEVVRTIESIQRTSARKQP